MERQAHLAQALESSQSAAKTLRAVWICTSGGVYQRRDFVPSQPGLAANDHAAEAAEFLGVPMQK